MEAEFYLKFDSEITGPFTVRELSLMKQQGQILTGTRIARSKAGPWKPVAMVPADAQKNAKVKKLDDLPVPSEDLPTPDANEPPNSGIVLSRKRYSSSAKRPKAKPKRAEENVKPSRQQLSVPKRVKKAKKTRDVEKKRVANNRRGLRIASFACFALSAHISAFLLAAVCMSLPLLLIGKLFFLCVEVFIPFSHVGIQLNQNQLAIAGTCFICIVGTTLAPYLFLARHNSRWLAYVLAGLVGVGGANVLNSIYGNGATPTLMSYSLVPIFGLVNTVSICASAAAFERRYLAKNAIIAVASIVNLFFLVHAYDELTGVVGFDLSIDSIPIMTRVNDWNLIILGTTIVLHYGLPFFVLMPAVSGAMDHATKNYARDVWQHSLLAGAGAVAALAVSYYAADLGWFSSVVASASLIGLAGSCLALTGLNSLFWSHKG